MPTVHFDDISFAWPTEDADQPEVLFSHLSLSVPEGFTFLVGPNGIGKSSFLLLAGARVFPQSGTVTVLGQDTRRFVDAALDPALEEARNQLVSFVYQNMEFETDAPIGAVLETVASASARSEEAGRMFEPLLEAAGLRERLSARMQELSKGEMQRAIVAMSLLYGSPLIMMDEPVFAVEPRRTEELFAFVHEQCRGGHTQVLTSVHDVELARRYADSVILFDSEGPITVGSAEEQLNRERLETAFRAPFDTLYERQQLYRELLTRAAEVQDGEES